MLFISRNVHTDSAHHCSKLSNGQRTTISISSDNHTDSAQPSVIVRILSYLETFTRPAHNKWTNPMQSIKTAPSFYLSSNIHLPTGDCQFRIHFPLHIDKPVDQYPYHSFEPSAYLAHKPSFIIVIAYWVIFHSVYSCSDTETFLQPPQSDATE
jgi:hypothetical protein